MKKTILLIFTICLFCVGCKNSCQGDSPVNANDINEDNALDMADKLLKEINE